MLTIFQNSVDLSLKMDNYIDGLIPLTITTTTPIQIGYYKAISDLYVALETFNANASTVTISYYNGSSWLPVTGLNDMTFGLTKSGYIKWDRDATNLIIPDNVTTLNGKSLIWYQISVSANTSALGFDGINLVFSTDDDLREEYPNISDHTPPGFTSFIGFHQAARDEIVNGFRVRGKLANNQTKSKMIDQWDLLNVEEIRQASKFCALAKIFYWLSDAVDDKWFQKAKSFEERYGKSLNVAYSTIDSNDNGVTDVQERNAVEYCEVVRV